MNTLAASYLIYHDQFNPYLPQLYSQKMPKMRALRITKRQPCGVLDFPTRTSLPGVNRTELASAFASYRAGGFEAAAATLSDIGGEHQGSRVMVNLNGRYEASEQLTLTAGPGASWASSTYNATFFGVSAEQAASTGLPVYQARAGLNTISLNGGVDYRLAPDWTAGLRLSVARLQGDAANSPVTASKSQNNVLIFLSRHF